MHSMNTSWWISANFNVNQENCWNEGVSLKSLYQDISRETYKSLSLKVVSYEGSGELGSSTSTCLAHPQSPADEAWDVMHTGMIMQSHEGCTGHPWN